MKRGRSWILTSILLRVGVSASIAAGGLWPTYLNLRQAYNNPRIVELSHGRGWGALYRGIEGIDGLFGAQDLLPSSFAGTPASMTLFGVPFIDPVVVPSVVFSGAGAWTSILPGLLAVLVVTWVFGRAWCSFGCPASLPFGASIWLREHVERRFAPVWELRRVLPEGIRHGILLGGTVAAAWSGAWVWQLLLPYLMVSTTLLDVVMGVPVGIATGLLGCLLLVDFLLLPGELCRRVCPLGLLLGRMSRHALVRLRTSHAACANGCLSCNTVCDLGLDPRDGAVADCSLCGRCVPVCPVERISIGVNLPKVGSRLLLAVMIAIMSLGLRTDTAQAHHYHGLPHYGYFDNYPQVPTEEYLVSEGRWELNFTLYNFQGMQRVDVEQPDDIQIFVVVMDLKNNKPFGGRAEITIRGGDEIVARWNEEAEQESIFLIHARIPEPDALTLSVRFSSPDGDEVLLSSPFHLPGEGGPNRLFWVGVGLLGVISVLAAASKRVRPVKARRRLES